MYAGMVGKTMIQNRLHIPVTVAIACYYCDVTYILKE